jgi:hypothetical protein
MTDTTPGTQRTGLAGRPDNGATVPADRHRRLSTETKSAFKTTEFWITSPQSRGTDRLGGS